MKKIDEMTRAELKQNFKNMYDDIGLAGSYQVMYELVTSVELLAEVIMEKGEK